MAVHIAGLYRTWCENPALSTQHAIAELIDNAFDAQATRIDMTYEEKEKDGRKTISLKLHDNGMGMQDKSALKAALTAYKRKTSPIPTDDTRCGKFGYGLPAAAACLCNRGGAVKILSKSEEAEDVLYCDFDLRKLTDTDRKRTDTDQEELDCGNAGVKDRKLWDERMKTVRSGTLLDFPNIYDRGSFTIAGFQAQAAFIWATKLAQADAATAKKRELVINGEKVIAKNFVRTSEKKDAEQICEQICWLVSSPPSQCSTIEIATDDEVKKGRSILRMQLIRPSDKGSRQEFLKGMTDYFLPAFGQSLGNTVCIVCERRGRIVSPFDGEACWTVPGCRPRDHVGCRALLSWDDEDLDSLLGVTECKSRQNKNNINLQIRNQIEHEFRQFCSRKPVVGGSTTGSLTKPFADTPPPEIVGGSAGVAAKPVKKKRTNITESVKKVIAATQGNKCMASVEGYSCPLFARGGDGSFDEALYEIDHIKEVSVSGDNSTDNLQALCPMCHRVKTRRFLQNKKKQKGAKAAGGAAAKAAVKASAR